MTALLFPTPTVCQAPCLLGLCMERGTFCLSQLGYTDFLPSGCLRPAEPQPLFIEMSGEVPLVLLCSGLKLVFSLPPQAHCAPAPPKAMPLHKATLCTYFRLIFMSHSTVNGRIPAVCRLCWMIQTGSGADWNPWLRGQSHSDRLSVVKECLT